MDVSFVKINHINTRRGCNIWEYSNEEKVDKMFAKSLKVSVAIAK